MSEVLAFVYTLKLFAQSQDPVATLLSLNPLELLGLGVLAATVIAVVVDKVRKWWSSLK